MVLYISSTELPLTVESGEPTRVAITLHDDNRIGAGVCLVSRPYIRKQVFGISKCKGKASTKEEEKLLSQIAK